MSCRPYLVDRVFCFKFILDEYCANYYYKSTASLESYTREHDSCMFSLLMRWLVGIRQGRDNYELLVEYHDRTKHLPQRYAASPGYLDWATQPVPFRFYTGSRQLKLPLIQNQPGRPYSALYVCDQEQQPLDIASIAAVLELSLGLSAWKQYQGSRWSLRMNPSSGNLHPTECYLLLPPLEQVGPSIAHYNPLHHCLEVRAGLQQDVVSGLSMPKGFGLILSSIYWREAWKYGERAIRYVNHDIGHAMAAIRYAANLYGFKVVLQPQVDRETLNSLLGFAQFDVPDEEREDADCLLWISSRDDDPRQVMEWIKAIQEPEYPDPPNRLSDSHRAWPMIQELADLTRSPGFDPDAVSECPTYPLGKSVFQAEEIIRKRRSAQGYDSDRSNISLEAFKQIMWAALPSDHSPFDVLGLEVNVDLFLFVHQVEELEPGLYCLLRDPSHLDSLQSRLKPEFYWHQPVVGLPLYHLQSGDFRSIAEMISCQQAIAGDSAFSLAMLARFEPLLKEMPWRYPSLYWETGLIGQVLYLEAEANGLQGTGIGCFFDDLMHELLGIDDHSWQDLYHFTIGSALVDDRIQTLPPYHHLEAERSGSR